MANIHPTSIVDSKAELDASVEVGPFCVIGPKVKVGPGTRFISHLRVEGPATIGKDNTFYPFGSIGLAPQDLKYRGEESELIVGDRNRFREYVTLNRGTTGGGNITRIGNDCLLMANAHVGHDSIVEDGAILANSVALAGHVRVKKGATVGGLCGVTQFNVIGSFAYVGACSLVHKDVPPYVLANGNPAVPRGINKVGLQRKGFSESSIQELHKAYRILYLKNLTSAQAIEEIAAQCDASMAEVRELLEFVRLSENGIIR